MADPVLDASAILADLWDEPGADAVRAVLPAAAVSAVNFAEVIAKLIDRGLSHEQVRLFADQFGGSVIAADRTQAMLAGVMRETTRQMGASLADRFCLALARESAAPVLTADRAWKDLDLGVEIRLIR